MGNNDDMARHLITLPLRLSIRSAGFALRGVAGVADRAVGLAGLVVGRSARPGTEAPSAARPGTEAPSRTERAPEPERAAAPDRSHSSPEPPAPPTSPDAIPTQPPPIHVSEEPVLVRESAEPGAEDGAGAEVTIAEPWDGYRHMNAADIVARLAAATTAELAAVQLYESAHRHRETVILAVVRQLRSANSPAK